MSGDDPGAAGGFMVSFAAGSRIAGYRLEEQIGKGGMAVAAEPGSGDHLAGSLGPGRRAPGRVAAS